MESHTVKVREMEKKEKKKIRTMDVILIVIAVFLLVFIALLLWMYYKTGGIPDTLCSCVFAVCGGECGVMGWIKTTKDKQQDRLYELEDRAAEKKEDNEDDT